MVQSCSQQTTFSFVNQAVVFHHEQPNIRLVIGVSRERAPNISKQAKMKKMIAPISTKKNELTKEEIAKYFSYSQSTAAKMLGISVSTLKRRYYAMNLGKWPYQYAKGMDGESTPRSDGGLDTILNKSPVDEKHLTKNVEKQLLDAFLNATASPGTPNSAQRNKF